MQPGRGACPQEDQLPEALSTTNSTDAHSKETNTNSSCSTQLRADACAARYGCGSQLAEFLHLNFSVAVRHKLSPALNVSCSNDPVSCQLLPCISDRGTIEFSFPSGPAAVLHLLWQRRLLLANLECFMSNNSRCVDCVSSMCLRSRQRGQKPAPAHACSHRGGIVVASACQTHSRHRPRRNSVI